MRNAVVQISIAIKSTVEPGRARASRLRNGEPGYAAGAAQPEERHPLDVGAEAHAAGDAGLKARRGDAGRGHGDDGVDVARRTAGVGERAARRLDEEILCALEIGRVALRPAEIRQVPVDRLHRVALADARGLEHRSHALEGGVAMGEDAARRRRGVGLQHAMRRHGMADGEKARARAGIV